MLQLRLQLNKKLLQAPGNGCLFFWRKLIMVIGNYKYGISRLPDDCMILTGFCYLKPEARKYRTLLMRFQPVQTV